MDLFDSQEIGILILAEFSIDQTEVRGFMHAASPGKEVLTLEEGYTVEMIQWLQELYRGVPRPQHFTLFNFRDPNQHHRGVLGVYWCRYGLSVKKCDLILLRFTCASVSEFQLSDLEIPLRLAGCVLIMDLKRFSRKKMSKEVSAETPSEGWIAEEFKKSFKQRPSAISKIRQAKLPFVVVPIEPYSSTSEPAMLVEEMSDLLELEPHIPVIPCKLDYDSLGEGVSKEMNFPFIPADVERVLSTLMEQIERKTD